MKENINIKINDVLLNEFTKLCQEKMNTVQNEIWEREGFSFSENSHYLMDNYEKYVFDSFCIMYNIQSCLVENPILIAPSNQNEFAPFK